MANYTTLAIVRERLNFEATETGDDALIGTLIQEASQYIDTLAQVTLVHTIGTLYAEPCRPYLSGRLLFFRDDVMAGVDSVINANGDVVPASDYLVTPLNGAVKSGLRIVNGASTIYQRTLTGGTLQIRGTLGIFDEGSVPADLRMAATLMTTYLYLNRSKSADVVQLADGTTITPQGVSELVTKALRQGGYTKPTVYF